MSDELERAQMGYGGKIHVEFRDKVAILTMDCGENRLNIYFLDLMQAALDQVLANPDIQVLITTGSGKFYSNGLDLSWIMRVAQEDQDRLKVFTDKLSKFWLRLLRLPLVTIAAINGHAYAGGAVTTLGHDYRIMTLAKGWWCLNEVHIGMTINTLILNYVTAKMPSGPAFNEAVILGRRYTAQEAGDAHIITHTCSGDVVEAAMGLANRVLPKQGYKREWLGKAKEDAFDWVDKGERRDLGGMLSKL